MREHDTAITFHRKYIEDEILVLHCPECHRGVFFPDSAQACFALTCSGCEAKICAFCLMVSPTGGSSHDHVSKCNLNWKAPHIFHSEEVWNECQKRRHLREIRAYLTDEIKDNGLALEVLRAVKQVSEASVDILREIN